MTHIQVQNFKKHVNYVSYIHTSHTKHIVPDLFNVRTIHCSNYGGKQSKKIFAFYDSDKLVTFKQDQGHQTWYELVDPKQGYNHAKLEKSCLEQCP